MQDECLYDATLVTHVRHHGNHVVICCAHERGPEYDGEVARLHLVHDRVLHHLLQVQKEVLQCLVVMIGQVVHLELKRNI